MSDARRSLLFLHPSAELYGADRTLLDLVRGLDAARWRAVVALPRRGPLADALEHCGAEVVVGPLGVGGRQNLSPRGLFRLAGQLVRGVRFVRRLVRELRPEVVHTNTMVVLGGALAARLERVPHVWHVHEILTRPRALARGYAWLFERLADVVVCNSRATLESFVRWRPSLAARARVIPNAVDLARLADAPSRQAARAQLGLPNDAPVVALVGRVNSWKGQGLLLEAAARLRRELPQLRIVLAGDAPPGQDHFEAALEDDVRRLALEGAVLRLPFMDPPSAVFAAADVVAVPSTRPEPFGLVVIEAMALGRPVVAANHGGPREILEHGVSGQLVEPCNAEALAEGLRGPLVDRELAQRMGLAARRRVHAEYRTDRYIGRFEELFEHLAEHRAVPQELTPNGPELVHLVLGKANTQRVNGVNRVVHHLAAAQAAAGVRVAVFGLTPDPDAPTPPRPYALHLFTGRRRIRWRAPSALRAALEALEPDAVVHLHGGFLPEMAAAARLLRRLDQPYVFTPHGAYDPVALKRNSLAKRVYLRLFERPLLRGARTVQAFTDPGRSAILAQCPAASVAVVTNGQTLPEAPPPPTDPPACFGFVGRLDAHTKGLDLLLDGFAAHVSSGGRARLLIVGDGPDRDGLVQRVRTLGLLAHVSFTGPLFGDALRSAYERMTGYVQCSRNEGLPGAPLEAASYGLPLILSEATHLGPVVRRHDAGRVLPALTAPALAQQLAAFEALPEAARRAIGERARDMVASEFGWGTVARRAATHLYRQAA